jgi:hypothetical protein
VTAFDRGLGAIAAFAITAGIAGMSHVWLRPHSNTGAMLRLAWTARPERVEQCETQSQEALAKLPPHMRQPQICDSVSADYVLEVRRDGVILVEEPVRGGGFRRDRALYVFREMPVAVGEATIDVRFTRVTPASEMAPANSRVKGTGLDGSDRASAAVPPSLRFTQRFLVRPREVVLITYDPDERDLVRVNGTF